MATESPEIDTTRREEPLTSTNPPPTVGDAAIAWAQLGGLTAVVNVVVFVVAMAIGASMEVDLGGDAQVVGAVSVVGASLLATGVATFVWALVAHRVPAFAELWVPLAWGFGIVSLAAILGSSGPATAVSLGLMHVIATAVGAHLVPRRLPREAT